MSERRLQDLERLIVTAESKRQAAPERRDVEAYRVMNGPADGAPAGLSIDRYRDWVVLSHRERLGPAVVEPWAEAAWRALGPEGLVVKTLRRSATASDSRTVRGHVPRAPVVVAEHGASFLVDLDAGAQTGLFLDHRETRLSSREYARGEEVLNLFAYTCAFSVHAALAGATRVTSVDVARRVLVRGRENMRASGLEPDRHRWFDDDVLQHVARGAPGSYGLVIVDPPVLGRAGRRTFVLDAQLEALAAGALRKLRPGGVMIFSTHALAISAAALESRLESVAASEGRRLERLRWLGLPAWDHPVVEGAPSEDDRGGYLKTLVLRVA
jgi:23S rRNA (cytosine1962-C5)-methyltransferase